MHELCSCESWCKPWEDDDVARRRDDPNILSSDDDGHWISTESESEDTGS